MLLFGWSSLMSNSGVCLKSGPLTGDFDDFLMFFQWDSLIEKEISICAKEKRSSEKRFKRLGKSYLLKIIHKKNLNFEYEIYELDNCASACSL